MKIYLFSIFLLLSFCSWGQTGIGTSSPNASAKFEVYATNKGFLPPRISLTSATDVSTIASPATGLLIYNTASAGAAPANVVPGYYYWNGSSWIQLANGLLIDNSKTASFSLASTDNNKVFLITASSTITVTVPNTLPVGFSCQLIQGSTGIITLLGSSVTLNSANGLSTRATNSVMGIVVNTSTTAFVFGDTIY